MSDHDQPRAAAIPRMLLTRNEAGVVFAGLLDALAIDRCILRSEVIAAVTADRPEVMPGWAYGFAGAGESFASAADPAVPNVRVADSVGLRFAFDEPHPANPFEHRAERGAFVDERSRAAIERELAE